MKRDKFVKCKNDRNCTYNEYQLTLCISLDHKCIRVCHAVYALLSYVYRCMNYTMMDVGQIYISEMTQTFTITLCNCAVTDHRSVMPETRRSLYIWKHYCDFGEVFMHLLVQTVTIVSQCTEWEKCKIQMNEVWTQNSQTQRGYVTIGRKM